LFERVDLATDQLNLLNVAGNLAFGIDATLRLGFKLGLDVVEQLIEALGWLVALGASHDTRRVVVHAGS
jgi:hypothetical protein